MRRSRRAARFLAGCAWFAWDRLRSALSRLAGRTPPACCVALCYHDVPEGSRAAFARQMDRLRRMAIPCHPAFAGPMEAGKRYAIVTIDDGFQSAVDNAFPELEKRGIPAAFLVPTGYIGRTPGWEVDAGYGEAMAPVAGEETLRKLSGGPVVVGSHTVSHARLAAVGEAQARSELVESRARLESILGREVRVLGLPYGSASPAVIRLAEEAGYERIFTSGQKAYRGETLGRVVGRFGVSPDDTDAEFALVLSGGYGWHAAWAELKGRFGK